jgi:hypothetical protein
LLTLLHTLLTVVFGGVSVILIGITPTFGIIYQFGLNALAASYLLLAVVKAVVMNNVAGKRGGMLLAAHAAKTAAASSVL